MPPKLKLGSFLTTLVSRTVFTTVCALLLPSAIAAQQTSSADLSSSLKEICDAAQIEVRVLPDNPGFQDRLHNRVRAAATVGDCGPTDELCRSLLVIEGDMRCRPN